MVSLKQQIKSIIVELQIQITKDMADGTQIPGRYKQIQNMLDQANKALMKGKIDIAMDIIGSINLDALVQVDEFDDLIGEMIIKLQQIQKYYSTLDRLIPEEIQSEITVLNGILDKYVKVSQLSP